MPQYAIYTRQSQTRPESSLASWEVQFYICCDFAEAVMPPGFSWCGTRYDDPNQSGSDLERPSLQALLADVRAGDIACVVVYSLDRLSRRLADAVRLFDLFEQHNVVLKIVNAPRLSDPSTNQLIRATLVALAEFERAMIGERVSMSIAARRRGGRRLSGKPPFGYNLPRDGTTLVVNRRESPRCAPSSDSPPRGAHPGRLPSTPASTAG